MLGEETCALLSILFLGGISTVKSTKALISSVRPDSIAYEAGVKPGQYVLKVNDRVIKDLIAYRYHTSSDYVHIEIEREDGSIFAFEAFDTSSYLIGIEFSDIVFDCIKSCRNKCIFCFEDQLPKNVRPSLRLKDDDYRLSFFQGNFITLTNLTEIEIKRICRLKLSPLYISVHTTDDEIRSFMIGRPYDIPILDSLKLFAKKGIDMHLQIVLVPNVNDGENLSRTFDDLISLSPRVKSVGVVPVGLSDHREGLYEATPVDYDIASRTLDIVETHAKKSLEVNKTRLFYAADEIYLKANREIPASKEYEDFCQIENGIGISRIFLDEFAAEEINIPPSVPVEKRIVAVTGQLACGVLTSAVKRLNQVENINLTLVPINNRFFGKNITVAGLVTASDIIGQLKSNQILKDATLIVPDVMLKDDRSVFLDDITVEELGVELDVDVLVVDSTASGFIKGVLGNLEELNV